MSKNPNFMDNRNRMTESMKVAYFQNGENEARNDKFMKYANSKQQYDKNSEEKQVQENEHNQNLGIQLGINARQINTENSQFSAENGFKKIKTKEIEMLNEFRNQFNILRQDQEASIHKQKSKSISDSSQHSQSQKNSNSYTSSIEPNDKFYQQKYRSNREERMYELENKKYEHLLVNFQQKIEELLHQETLHKKTIFDLRAQLENLKTSKDPEHFKVKAELNLLRSELQAERDRYKDLESSNERLKSANKRYEEKITSFESSLSSKNQEERRREENRQRMEDLLRLEKDKVINAEIETRKIKMEYQILEKDKNQQLARLQKQFDHEKAVSELSFKNTIKRLEDDITVKERRYTLLLSEYEKLRRQYHEVQADTESTGDNTKVIQMFQEFMKEKNRGETADVKNLVNSLLQKMNKPPANTDTTTQQKLLAEIRILQQEIERLRFMKSDDSDLQTLRSTYESEIMALKDNIRLLETKLREKYVSQLSASMPKPPAATLTNQPELRARISELQRLLRQKQVLIQELDEQWKFYRNKWQKIEQQYRVIKRKLDEADFQALKLKKQLNFRLDLIKKQNEASQRMHQAELEAEKGNVLHWKAEFENIRRFYEIKIAQKNQLLERSSPDPSEATVIKQQYDASLLRARKEYDQHIKMLAEKLAKLAETEKELDHFRRRYSYMENAFTDIKSNYQRSRELNEGVDHLWQMKEVEYNNIATILRQTQFSTGHADSLNTRGVAQSWMQGADIRSSQARVGSKSMSSSRARHMQPEYEQHLK